MNQEVRAAYSATAAAWSAGPERVYRRLAEAALDRSPVPVAGCRVLDVGAGTGVAGRVALAAGARWVVATDLSAPMLAAGRATIGGHAVFPVLADAVALPLRPGTVDLVIAACCLGHLADPTAGLREARRVGGALVATAFRAGWTHPAKAAVDDVLGRCGFRPPPWYRRLKQTTEPLVDDPVTFARLAASAGWTDPRAEVATVPTGLRSPAELAAWRLGMAHVATFLVGLDAERRAAVRRDAEIAVAGMPELSVPLVVLSAAGSG